MKQLQHTLHYPYKNSLCILGCLAACLDTGLCQLDIPVAVYVPDKVIKLCAGNAQLKCLKILINFLCKSVELAYDPLILCCKILGETRELKVLGEIHKNES